MLEGLTTLPAGLTCPWPVARIFNELLKQSRREAPEDPILKGIRFFEEGSGDLDVNGSNALVGTVTLLARQVIVALDEAPQQVQTRKPPPSRARAAR
ncbi:MAG: hypothetical protein ACYC91_02630 [Solirubrobacteraceae bacterium]